MRQAVADTPRNGIYAGVLRALSLLLAIVLSGAILAYPKALAYTSHGLLSLVMLGLCAGFVHGVGFVPEHKLWRALFGPWVAWLLMGFGLWLLLDA
jgi:cyd operon protein YbgE